MINEWEKRCEMTRRSSRLYLVLQDLAIFGIYTNYLSS